jgi:hypothetical protein
MDERKIKSRLRKEKTKKLIELIDGNKHAPAQGSVEWIQSRHFSIGGSEIASFMSDIPYNKPYQNIRKLVETKLGLDTFKGNKYTRWGNLCEELTRLFAENTFHTEIYETGSLPGSIPHHHYSPDGLGIVDKKYIKPYVSESHYESLPSICCSLFEFKNPYSRIPDGNIPVHYMIQVQVGLNDIPLTDVGIFLDMVVRPCSLNDLDWTNNYNTSDFKDPFTFGKPTAIGFIGFAYPRDNEEEKSISDTDFENLDFSKSKKPSQELEVDEDEMIDFGDTSEKNFYIVSQKVVSKIIKPYYTNPIPGRFKFYHELEKFEQHCKKEGTEIIGILPYKIFDVKIASVKKESGFIKQHHIDSIVEAIRFVKKYKNRSMEDKLRALDKYYPKNQGSSKKEIPYLSYLLS